MEETKDEKTLEERFEEMEHRLRIVEAVIEDIIPSGSRIVDGRLYAPVRKN